MSERAGYSRIYWNLVDDPKFAEVYANDAAFAAWTRLLMMADQSWPTSAHLPVTARRSAIAKLAEVGLIDLLPGDRFRVHGLDAERERRKALATSRGPSGDRPVPGRVSPDTKSGPLVREQVRGQDENEDADAARADAEDPATTYWALTGRFPTEKTLAWIDDLSGRYGFAAVDRALAAAHIEDRSTQTLLGRAQDKLRAEARELDRKERADEQARLREKRAVAPKVEPWREEFRRRIEEQYGDAA